jgi:hypothetical protein
MSGYRAFVTAAFTCLLAISGCDNTPLETTTGVFVASGWFDAYRVSGVADGTTTTSDSTYVILIGTDATTGLHMDMNGTDLPMVATFENQALYTNTAGFVPGDTLTLTVSDSRRSYTNSITTPAIQPVFATPNPEIVYSRLDSLEVSWSEATNGGIEILVSEDLGEGVVGDTLWNEVANASTGGIFVPPTIWQNRVDTSAVISLWQESQVSNTDGFSGGLQMRARLITVGRVLISPISGTE